MHVQTKKNTHKNNNTKTNNNNHTHTAGDKKATLNCNHNFV